MNSSRSELTTDHDHGLLTSARAATWYRDKWMCSELSWRKWLSREELIRLRQGFGGRVVESVKLRGSHAA